MARNMDALRLQEISGVLKKIAQGDYSARIPLNSQEDEIDALARSVNQLTGDLQKGLIEIGRQREHCISIVNVVRSMLNPVILVDQDVNIRQVNPAAVVLLGYSEEELVGRSLLSLCRENQDQVKKPVLTELFVPGGVNHEECDWFAKDGQSVPVLVSGSLLYDAQGNVEGALCMVLDLTLRKEVEQLHRIMIENSPDSIITIDPAGYITMGNPVAFKMLGYHKDELLGKHFSQIAAIDPEETSRFIEIFNRAIGGELEDKSLELQFKHKSGAKVWLELRFGALQKRDEVIGLQIISRDITERRLAEREKRMLEQQLHQAQKMEAIGQLAGGVAHDFNNILSGLNLHLGLLEMKLGPDSPLLSYVTKMMGMTQKAAGISKQLLNFARKSQFDVRPLDVHESIIQVVEILKYSLSKKIVVETEFAATNPMIAGDFSQIANILLNLGINARDAMPDGGTLRFGSNSIMAVENAGGPNVQPEYIEIVVSDTGIGMDEKTQMKIFEPFFTTKENGKGTGLGLASVYGTVEQHKGYVRVFSQPGRGTQFKLYFPVIEAEEAAAAESDLMNLQSGDGHILVADDEEPVRDAMTEILRKQAYRVDAFSSGQALVDYFTGHHQDVDMVILASGLADMDDAQCLGKMKAIDPDIKIVIASGRKGDRQLQYSGISAVLDKPFKAQDLVGLVSRLLKG